MGIFSKKTTAAGGLWGLIIGFVIGMSRLTLKIFSESLNQDGFLYTTMVAPNWLHFCIVLFVICIVSIIIISLFTKKPTPEMLRGLVYGSGTPEQVAETRSSWNNWDLFHSAVIIIITIAFYAYFW